MEMPHTQFLKDLMRNHSSTNKKLSWEELCTQVSSRVPPKPKHTFNQWDERIQNIADDGDGDNDGKDDDDVDNICMSRQLIARLSSFPGYVHNETLNKILVSVLRHEDAVHIPLLQIDSTSGTITDWNRAMTDLTGIAKSDVVGKTYANILNEWAPNLSEEYRAAAVDWIGKKEDDPMDDYHFEKDKTKLRGHYMFPLPLPIKHTFANATSNNDDCWYIELLSCRTDEFQLSHIYSCHFFAEWKLEKDPRLYGSGQKRTNGWIGGAEFTLRRKQVLLSPRSLTGAIDGDGSMAFTNVISEKQASSDTNNEMGGNAAGDGDGDVYDVITNYIRSCPSIGIEYIREVLYHIRMAMRKPIVNPKKAYSFTKNWTTNTNTAEVNKAVMKALGGDRIFEQNVTGWKMTWRLAFTTSNSKNDMHERFDLDNKRLEWERKWKQFLKKISPVVGESKHSRSTCAAIDTPNIIPGIDHPERALLTLKIEGIERNAGSYEEEKFKAWATVQVPATLNFFQLHRVVNQTMNCSSHCARETHVWKTKNIAPEMDLSDGAHGHTDYIELGETYFIENGKKAESNEDNSLFGNGEAIRQRVSRTAAHYDQIVPLYCDPYSGRVNSINKIYACIHSTCISAVFYQPGAAAILEDGMIKYCTKFRVTCTRIDEYKGPLPENSNINVMLPKCLRGKPEDGHWSACDWSLNKANAQLEKDRGCLRRMLCPIGTKDGMQVMPWCWSGDYRFGTNNPSMPLAAQLKGTDLRPMFLFGEPPLPGSSKYTNYVSNIDGRIDPEFLQENVVDMSEFAVPFKRGTTCKRSFGYDSYDEDPKSNAKCEPSLGEIWEREVDEERKRIKSLLPKQKANSKGKKRKLDSSL